MWDKDATDAATYDNDIAGIGRDDGSNLDQVKSKSEPHVANLKQDFTLIKNMALQEKQIDAIDDWIKIKVKDTYIKLEAPYEKCDFRLNVWN